MEEILSIDHVKSEIFYDEIFDEERSIRPYYAEVMAHFGKISKSDFKRLNELTRANFFKQGITFAVYSEQNVGVERIFPFDLIPRVIPRSEWCSIENGILQRNIAVNMFIKDVYNEKHILRDGVVPADLIFSSSFYCREMEGFIPPSGIYTHIVGTDLIRHSDGDYYVLEDNLRCPSGVSYVLSNREAMKKAFFNLFSRSNVMPVNDYPQALFETIRSVAPQSVDKPNCVVLTPGFYNSAYFEHSFLAMSMGMQLVEGRDLFVEHNFVYMKTINGPKRVDVIYRRIDDEFIDPLCFRENSFIGVPGIMGAYRSGNVTLINAPGAGMADDKAVYTYMPDIIRYYLGEDMILKNVQTYKCENASDLKFVMEHMGNLVVKPVDESGGYGVFIGTKHTKAEAEAYKKLVLKNPRKYIAQPIMNLSVQSTYIEEADTIEPRHIDLRAFSLMGKDKNFVLKGGLTRVALKKGSLIVNSSQGGGSKDTWVV
ncbi:MAG TPA: circularly permuted type 2 ATP-grasp protein [Cytophagales bacterium]|nr:circularly permuted type 2 ATP-grasp protein [Cytophagales bacterium]